MKRRAWAIAATFTLAGLGLALPAAAAKKNVPVKEPSDDGSDSDSSGSDSGESGEAKGETEGTKVAKPSKSPNQGGPDKDNPQARAAGDHVAMPPKMEGKGTATANENHTVETGDTLWDSSQKYLGNPWYWPKVWSYNPQIANHPIYPGDQVKFYPGAGGDAEAPAQVEDNGEVKAPEEESGDMGEEDENGPLVSGGTYKIAKSTRSSFRSDGFVTQRELEESGQIFKSLAETEMLDNLADVYMRFKSSGDVKVGDRFFIFTTERELKHPITGASFGFVTRIVGTVRIDCITDNQVVEGMIDQTWGEIYRGYYLAPYSDKPFHQVSPKPSATQIKGVVVDSGPELEHIGAWEVVFIDKGKRDGVEEGTEFRVVRRSDGSTQMMKSPGDPGFYDPGLPEEVIGLMITVDVKEEAATCLVLKSAHEFVPGDVVESLGDLTKVSSR